MAQMFIGGEWRGARSGATYTVFNPATEEPVDTVPLGGPEDVEEAVRAAKEAFGDWSRRDFEERGEILRKGIELLKAHREEIIQTLTLEQGKPLHEAQGEFDHLLHGLAYYADLATKVRGAYQPLPSRFGPAYGLVVKRPMGVVAAIVPWNFPTTLLANKLGPALVTGNTVVAKPAETTPLTTLRIAALFHEAGLPPGVFNVVTGLGPVAGEVLVRHPLVRKVAFTGSTPVGKRIMALAAEGVKRVTLELGGSDPMIVCDDADLDAAAKAAAVGRFFNCGQACLAVKRLYVFENVYEAFMERFLPRVERLRLGPGLSEDSQMGPLHTERQRRLIEEQLRDGLESGGRLLLGGGRPEGLQKGYFFSPTVVLEPGLDSRLAREEVFGPVLPVWRVRSLEEAVELANRSPYGLGSTIFTRSLERASYALERLEAGYTWVNSVNRIYDELPFGGMKESGYGKEHGLEALEYYQETKAGVVRWR